MPNRFKASTFHWALSAQGINFKKAFEAAVHNQSLVDSELDRLQVDDLRRVLSTAAKRNTAYHDLLSEQLGPAFDFKDIENLSTLPVLSKDDLAEITIAVEAPRGFHLPMVKRTSGSSGRPLALLKQRSGLARELAATWRSYGWYDLHPGDRHVRVWGRPLNWRKRAFNSLKGMALNSISISAFDVTEAALRSRISEICAAQPKFIYGYASALRELAHFAMATNTTFPSSLRIVVSTAEPLDTDTRSVIEAGFGVPCKDEYGCSEVGSIAHECAAGSMHIMADNIITEVLQENGTVSSTGFGELLVTDLTNELTPVIRYRVGDFCELSESSRCQCRLIFPVVSNILGRVEDTIVMPNGTSHHPAKICYLVDKADKQVKCVRQYQVIQHAPLEFELRIVTGDGYSTKEFEARAKTVFADALGDNIVLNVHQVAEIGREASGKFRIVQSRCNQVAIR